MYAPILRNLPEEMRMPMLELVEAIEHNMRAELAVRREDFESLQGIVHETAERTYQVEQRLDGVEAALTRLAEAQARTEQTLRALIEQMYEMSVRLNGLRGDNLERRYRERAHGYFGRLLRRVRVVDFYDIEPQLEERLPADMVDDLRLLDLIVRGRHKERAELDDLWLAVEVSFTVDRNDVNRAQRRAAALRQAGYKAVPVVAGHERTDAAEDGAAQEGVVLLQDGSVRYWEEALRAVS